MEDQDIVKEFLVESTENLAHLELAVVELERRPTDPELLVYRFNKTYPY